MFPEKFDPWMLIAVPMFYAILAAYVVRDFISSRLRTNTHLEQELRRMDEHGRAGKGLPEATT